MLDPLPPGTPVPLPTLDLYSGPPGWIGVRFLRGGKFVGRATIVPESEALTLTTEDGIRTLATCVGAILPARPSTS